MAIRAVCERRLTVTQMARDEIEALYNVANCYGCGQVDEGPKKIKYLPSSVVLHFQGDKCRMSGPKQAGFIRPLERKRKRVSNIGALFK